MVLTGRILRFDEMRGYGFIVPDNGGEDVFVHANDFLEDKRTFGPGTIVEFEVTEGERGLKAFAVRALRDTGSSVTGSEPDSFRESSAAEFRSVDDDETCDVLSHREFLNEVTEMLLKEVPTVTGLQITQMRQHLLGIAQRHGWVED